MICTQCMGDFGTVMIQASVFSLASNQDCLKRVMGETSYTAYHDSVKKLMMLMAPMDFGPNSANAAFKLWQSDELKKLETKYEIEKYKALCNAPNPTVITKEAIVNAPATLIQNNSIPVKESSTKINILLAVLIGGTAVYTLTQS